MRAGTKNTLAFVAGMMIPPAGIVMLIAEWGIRHHIPPRPAGMVCRIVANEADSPVDRFIVEVVELDPPAIAIEMPLAHSIGRTRSVFGYPSGEWLRAQPAGDGTSTASGTMRPFDLDGDGVADTVRIGEGEDYGLVEVVSGASGRVIFEDDDPLDYENPNRAFPLGDIDGDGFSELALVHPRINRSRYDFEVWDSLFGAHSWVTVVSGSRIFGK